MLRRLARPLVASPLARPLVRSAPRRALWPSSSRGFADGAAPPATAAPSAPGAASIFDADYDYDMQKAGTKFKQDYLKYWKPNTPGQRGRITVDGRKAGLHRGKPFKPLTVAKQRTGGRGDGGRTTMWHHGGGNKKRLRIVDFKRQMWDVPATVERLEYDPNRSSWLALIKYDNGVMSYILAPQGLGPGDRVVSGRGEDAKGMEPRPGNAAPLRYLPLGIQVHNVELRPLQGAKMVRGAGTAATFMSRTDDGFAVLRMPSKEQRMVPILCMATVGAVSNPLHKMQNIGKAGANRWKGKRPTVRGVAMNPVDHPMGGGEGKKSKPGTTPWGYPCKQGYRTRKRRKPTRALILQDRRGLALPKTLKERKQDRLKRIAAKEQKVEQKAKKR